MVHKILYRDLKEGNVVPIYLDWKQQLNYQGDAVLIKRLEDKEDPEHVKEYLFTEIGDHMLLDRKKSSIRIIYSYQKWIIKFINGNNKGFRTIRNIAHYRRNTYYVAKKKV